MDYIVGLIGSVLGWLMYYCYRILPNYLISIILFTFAHEDRPAASIFVGAEKFYQDGKNAA